MQQGEAVLVCSAYAVCSQSVVIAVGETRPRQLTYSTFQLRAKLNHVLIFFKYVLYNAVDIRFQLSNWRNVNFHDSAYSIFIYLPIHLAINLIHPSIHSSIRPSVCPSVCSLSHCLSRSIYLSFCFFVFFYIRERHFLLTVLRTRVCQNIRVSDLSTLKFVMKWDKGQSRARFDRWLFQVSYLSIFYSSYLQTTRKNPKPVLWPKNNIKQL